MKLGRSRPVMSSWKHVFSVEWEKYIRTWAEVLLHASELKLNCILISICYYIYNVIDIEVWTYLWNTNFLILFFHYCYWLFLPNKLEWFILLKIYTHFLDFFGLAAMFSSSRRTVSYLLIRITNDLNQLHSA